MSLGGTSEQAAAKPNPSSPVPFPTAAKDQGVGLGDVWRAATTALPVAAALLPATGYTVRAIAFMFAPWVPPQLAASAPLGQLALTGFFAAIPGFITIGLYLVIFSRPSKRADGKTFIYPIDTVVDTWEQIGPTAARRAQIRAFLSSAKVTMRGGARRTGRAVFGRLRTAITAPGLAGRAVLRFVNYVVIPGLLLVGLVSVFFTYWTLTVGQPIGTAIQAIAGLLALWYIRRLVKRYGKVDLVRAVPMVVAFLVAAAIGSGLNPSFPTRPSSYVFAPDVGLTDGLYQEIGSEGSVVYLVSCGSGGTNATVVGIPLAGVRSFRVLSSYTSPKRTSLVESFTRWEWVDVGYRSC